MKAQQSASRKTQAGAAFHHSHNVIVDAWECAEPRTHPQNRYQAGPSSVQSIVSADAPVRIKALGQLLCDDVPHTPTLSPQQQLQRPCTCTHQLIRFSDDQMCGGKDILAEMPSDLAEASGPCA